jgi:hypothetical protein
MTKDERPRTKVQQKVKKGASEAVETTSQGEGELIADGLEGLLAETDTSGKPEGKS